VVPGQGGPKVDLAAEKKAIRALADEWDAATAAKEYLAKVQRGGRLHVTSRSKVIAEIVPPVPPKDEAAAARARLRGSVLRYDGPIEPAVPPEEWKADR
jgi:antitoxin (DNA-binding transcriptional repressor) of toxin-antitoxin stability system